MAEKGFFSRHSYPHELPPPPDLGTSVPSIARTYDALLDGKDNFAADRAAARAIEAANPGSRALVRHSRRFLERAVRHAAETLEIDQFLDLGSGLPRLDNTHQIARRGAPKARVVYVDTDPMVLTHGRALLADGRTTEMVAVDLRDVDAVMAAAHATRLVDPDRPVCVLLVGLLHHLPDSDDPWGIVGGYVERTAPGSMLALSHLVTEDTAAARALDERMLDLGLPWGRVRAPGEVARMFDGVRLVSPARDDSVDPALVDCASWRDATAEPAARPADPSQRIWEHGGVGVRD